MLAVAMLPHDEGGGEGQVPCRIGDEVQPHKAHVLVRNKVDEDLWGHLGRASQSRLSLRITPQSNNQATHRF
jgi:hypothetical protein